METPWLSPKKARLQLGLTINEMAKACGVHRQTLVKWERGERTPSAAAVQLFRILTWLHSNELLDKCLKESPVL